MEDFKIKDYKIFDMFDKQWAIVSSGNIDNFNCCTISWGSLGTIWGHSSSACPIVTIYIHPARYTSEFLKNNEYFTLNFFDSKYKKDLAYIGTHSGKNEDKVSKTDLTPIQLKENTVGFSQANLTFVCKKLYQHQFSKEDLDPQVQQYYASSIKTYPDFKGGWQPHIVFIGEIIDVIDKR